MRPIFQFYQILDSGIRIAKQKVLPENDLSLMYNAIGRHFIFERKLDTARQLLKRAQKYITLASNKNLRTEVDIYSKLG